MQQGKIEVPKTTIIYCHCAYYQIIPDGVKSAVLDALKNAGIEFEAVPDLCRLCANKDPALKSWAKADRIKIIACYPRAVRWLFHAAGAPLPQSRKESLTGEGVEFLNMRTDSIEKITSSLLDGQSHLVKSKIENRKSECPPLAGWIPWFPVIDYDRCKNCLQCFNFCLFGVYELSEEQKVKVTKPANCKTNCPACARMCPQSAIIFPKYNESPINGDEVSDSASQDEKTKVNINELLSRNIYDTIRRHSKMGKRFSKDAEQPPTEQEKYSVLKKLQQELDIPSDVLETLSPGQRGAANKGRGTNEKEHHE